MNAVELKSLQKVFRAKRGKKVEALKGISFEIEMGEIFGFLGPNGAGKSTTIKILVGLLIPTSGEALLFGESTSKHSMRRRIGYLPENPAYFDYLSAEEYLVFAGKSCGMTPDQIVLRSEIVLRRLEMWDARKRSVRSYSKGMVQRFGLAQVLLHDPDLYILDEPMSGLDPIGRALVKEIMLELKARGKGVFFSTHITSDVELVCDRVGVIVEGKLQRVENVENLLVSGISGYSVRVRDNDHVREVNISCEELTNFLVQCRQQGREVIVVEPRRKHLEDFFLEIVKSH